MKRKRRSMQKQDDYINCGRGLDMGRKIKGKTVLIAVILLCLLPASPAAALSGKAAVTIPDFPVTLNGEQMNNTYNPYPLLVYKDITYFPMTYDYARFLGLKANWYEKSRRGTKGVLFIGVAENPATELKQALVKTANKKSDTARIPDYSIALNTTSADSFLDNSREEYPILNFRDITYFPLTWRFAVDEFGWTYSFDAQNGLQINSAQPFRPVINDKVLGATLPSAGEMEYWYGTDYYVGYPSNTMYSYTLIVRKRGGQEKEYSLKSQMTDGDYYFNRKKDEKGADVTGLSPSIEGNIFSIHCNKRTTGGDSNVLLKINLDNGQLL